jgi:hypothetical protein
VGACKSFPYNWRDWEQLLLFQSQQASVLQLVVNRQCSPCSPSAVTGQTVYVDNGLSIMGLAVDSKTLDRNA